MTWGLIPESILFVILGLDPRTQVNISFLFVCALRTFTWILWSSHRMTNFFYKKIFIKIKRINDLGPGVKPQDDKGEFLSLFFLKRFYKNKIKKHLHLFHRQYNIYNALGVVAQLVRASACHAEGRGFEPRQSRQYLPQFSAVFLLFILWRHQPSFKKVTK